MTMRERLTQTWTGYTAREQGLLAFLAVLLLGTVVWFGVLSPTLSWRAEAERRYVAAVEGYETMLVQLSLYESLAQSATRPQSGQSLRGLADQTARERGLAITRVQPLDDGRLGVWMDGVSSDALMGWLNVLARDHGVWADRVSLDREGEGVVRAQLTLAQAGAS